MSRAITVSMVHVWGVDGRTRARARARSPRAVTATAGRELRQGRELPRVVTRRGTAAGQVCGMCGGHSRADVVGGRRIRDHEWAGIRAGYGAHPTRTGVVGGGGSDGVLMLASVEPASMAGSGRWQGMVGSRDGWDARPGVHRGQAVLGLQIWGGRYSGEALIQYRAFESHPADELLGHLDLVVEPIVFGFDLFDLAFEFSVLCMVLFIFDARSDASRIGPVFLSGRASLGERVSGRHEDGRQRVLVCLYMTGLQRDIKAL